MSSTTSTTGTVANTDAGSGTPAWSNLTNTTSSNNAYTSVTLSTAQNISDFLDCTNFGFSIPSGATLDGIEVILERKKTGSGTAHRDRTIQLIKGGTAQGNNKADTANNWPTSDTDKTYGSSTDLWGLTFTDSDINASNFGVRVQLDVGTGNPVFDIDYLRITVYYTGGAGGPTGPVQGSMTLLGVGR